MSPLNSICLPDGDRTSRASQNSRSKYGARDFSSLEEHSIQHYESVSSSFREFQTLAYFPDAHFKEGTHQPCTDVFSIRSDTFHDFDWARDSESEIKSSFAGAPEKKLTFPEPLLHIDRGCSLLDPEWVAATFKALNCSSQLLLQGHADWTAKRVAECFPYIATKDQLDALMFSHPLPVLPGAKWRQDLRYIYWSAYQKLWALVVLINVAFIAVVLSQPSLVGGFNYHQASAAMGSNFLVAAFGRQEHVLNLLFRIACLLPHSTPLRIRRQVAHLYTYGGLHAGCGISAFLWYVLFTILLVKQFEGPYGFSLALGPLTAIIFAILLLVLVMSLPRIRLHHRDLWELSHRYGGWSAIILSWAQTLIMIIAQSEQSHRPISYELIQAPTFWILSLISICLIYPWVRLRRRKVEAEVLSDEAVRLWFNDCKLPTCVAYNLSHAPLIQNHAFATIPNDNKQSGYSIVVSKAGDWTTDLVDNPPKRIWTRGAPTTGALRIAALFRPIVLVAVGSGIGPCLSFLQEYSDYPMRILWAACSPESAYGCRIVNAVLRADRNAVVIDTNKTGEPDLTRLAYALYRQISAEAVVVVSSATATRQLVYELEARSVPAFGPIF